MTKEELALTAPYKIMHALEFSWAGDLMREVSWLFAFCETLHFIGLCTLMGALLIVDLRLIGVIKKGSIKSTLNFTYLAMAGFAMNLISGFGCFASNPTNYYENPLFRWKMLAILIAGLNLAFFELVERKKLLALPEGAPMPLESKISGAASLLLWTAVIILGRFLPVTALGGG